MSGGHFDYKQYEIGRIADVLEDELHVRDNDEFNYRRIGIGAIDPDEGLLDNGRMRQHVIAGVRLLRLAEIVTHRFDWLISADDGEDSFYSRLESDLKEQGLWETWLEFLRLEGVERSKTVDN